MKGVVISFVLWVLSLSLAAQSECAGSDDPKAKKLFEKGWDAARSGDGTKAYTYYLQAIELDPEFPDPYYRLGMINRTRAKRDLARQDTYFSNAKKYYTKVIELCPDFDHYVYYYLGEIEYILEDYSAASLHLKTFIDNPKLVKNDRDYLDAENMWKEAKLYASLMNADIRFEPVVVNGISTGYDEYRFILSPDNEIALFTRKLESSGRVRAYDNMVKYEERFMFSQRVNGAFDEGRALPYPFNETGHESGTLTADNNWLFVMICKLTIDTPAYLNCDICVSQREEYGWGELQNLGGGVNSDSTWEAQPSISADGNMLFFTSDRPGGMGGYDLYRCRKQSDGSWGIAENLGPSINTSGNEISPYLHSDSHTLYFASSDRVLEDGTVFQGHAGMGGYDIFYTRYTDAAQWSKPKNIGYPINTVSDEIAFFVSLDGQTAYFASKKISASGNWDIFSFELYEDARPQRVLFLRGEIKDEEQEPLGEAIVEIENVNTKKVTRVEVDSRTGKYVAILPLRNDYIVTVKKENYTWDTRYIAGENLKYREPVDVELQPRKIELGQSYKLHDIYFETNSDELTAASLPVLDQFIQFLRSNPKMKVAIHGHTDAIGDDASNQILSVRRALAVYNYLIDMKIDADRLSYAGFGESKPEADNSTESGRAKNRRTEFVVMGK